MACLAKHDWPGNVRELENAIEHALVLGHSHTLLPEDLPESILKLSSSPDVPAHEGRYHSKVRELKKQLILDAVEQTRGNYVDAAGILGVHPNYLHRLIRNLALKDALKDALKNELKEALMKDVPREEANTGGRFNRASNGAA
jgi:DNA-binding NtrC family response regulator